MFERLSLSHAQVHIGLKQPFSVLHISDTHLTAAYPSEPDVKQTLHKMRTRTFGGRQEEALRDSLSWAKENVDWVIHTGDLIDWQSEANYDLVRKYFGQSMSCSMGNHEFSPSMGFSNPRMESTEAYKDISRKRLSEVFPVDISFHSQTVCGVNFITMDDVFGTVTAGQVERFNAEVRKGLPMVLCMHVPFFDDGMWTIAQRFWRDSGKKFRKATVPDASSDYARQRNDPVTRDFIARLKREPLLKCILTGHEHIGMRSRFSPTAEQLVVPGNFLFAGEEVLFS